MAASFAASAQQEQGDLSIQFSGNFTSQTIEYRDFNNDGFKTKLVSGNIYVKIGKFFTPNIEMGVKPNIYFSPKITANTREPGKPKTTLKTTVGFGLYGTYSFLTADAKFMPYGGAEVNYIPVGSEATVNLGPYVGVKYFVTETINIDANINYLVNLASTYGNEVRGLDISPLLQFNLGIGVIIGKRN